MNNSISVFDCNLDDILKDAMPATDLNNACARIISELDRDEEVRRLKENYPRKYLLENGMVTRTEYENITGSSNHKRTSETAELMPQIVGSEQSYTR